MLEQTNEGFAEFVAHVKGSMGEKIMEGWNDWLGYVNIYYSHDSGGQIDELSVYCNFLYMVMCSSGTIHVPYS